MKLRQALAVSATATMLMMSLAMCKGGGTGPVVEGSTVPEFKMTGLDGKTYTDQGLRGKVVLVDFWASWCAPCRMSSPAMQRLHEEFGSKGLVVIGANTSDGDESQSRRAAEDYVKEHGYTYAMTLANDATHSAWGFAGIPVFVLIGKDGTVLYIMQDGWGPGVEDELRDKIRSAVAS